VGYARSSNPPPDLWIRLARLAERCEMRMSSEPEPQTDGSWRWVWRVMIRPREKQPGPPRAILVMAPSALAAMTEALAEAESRGWTSGPEGGRTDAVE
jgi:hypothetical protein